MIQTLDPPAGYAVAEAAHSQWVIREVCREVLLALPVTDPAALSRQPGAEQRRGRAVHWSVETAVGRLVVRSYRRGGLVGRLLQGWYFNLGGPPRPLVELRAGEAARAVGVPTPEILGAVWQRQGPLGYRGWIVVREVTAAQPLAALWDEPGAPADRFGAVRAAGEAVAALHEAGFSHPDLNAGNILLQRDAGAWRAWLIDFDGVRRTRRVPLRRRAAELWRLARSCAKHRAAGAPLPRLAAAPFLAGYLRRSTCSQAALMQALRATVPWMRAKWWFSDRLKLSRPVPTHAVLWTTSL